MLHISHQAGSFAETDPSLYDWIGMEQWTEIISLKCTKINIAIYIQHSLVPRSLWGWKRWPAINCLYMCINLVNF